MMNKFVPGEKMSKKARREIARAQRGTWGALNPVTRRARNPKAYDRKKLRQEEGNFDAGAFCLYRPAC